MLVKKREDFRQSRSAALCITNIVLAVFLCPVSAWGWGNDGHKIVAIIAADNLTPAAQSHVANILGVPADQIATAMEAASIRPDSEFREEDRSTAPWHFIDICLQDRRIDIPARCPGGNCVTGKIDEYSRRLKEGNYDRWGAAGDLAFLIHFVGDIHQPLHTANDADRGGNCVMVDSQPRAKNLHDAWDTTIVRRLERASIRDDPRRRRAGWNKHMQARKRSMRGFRDIPTISRGSRIKSRVPTSMRRCKFQSSRVILLPPCAAMNRRSV